MINTSYLQARLVESGKFKMIDQQMYAKVDNIRFFPMDDGFLVEFCAGEEVVTSSRGRSGPLVVGDSADLCYDPGLYALIPVSVLAEQR